MPIGPAPVIMQYISPNPQSNGIQYVQLIPINIPQVPQYNPTHASPATVQHSTTASTQYAPASAYTQNAQNYVTYPGSLQSSLGGYSTPIISYFRPHSGIQLINAPVDMSLNTNEYIPIQAANSYKMRRA